MIYKNTYLKKELRQSYTENKISSKRRYIIGLFLTVITLALHMLLQIMYESVLTELFPYFMLPSNFTVLYTYNTVAYFFFALYLCAKYYYVTFAEILNNRWYLMIKMGYNPVQMTLSKLSASALVLTLIYTVGYALTIITSLIFKYPFVIGYLMPMFIIGLMSSLYVMILIMTISLFIKGRFTAVIVIALSVVISKVIEYVSGYHLFVTDRTQMSDVTNILTHPITYSIIAIMIVMSGVCFYTAREKSIRYIPQASLKTKVFVRHYEDNKLKAAGENENNPGLSIALKIGKFLITAILLSSVILNAIILVSSLGSTTKEFSINGVIPYVFQSDTMKDEIQKNDLVYFKQIGDAYPLNVGDIVLFKEGSEPKVSKIMEIDKDQYTVDITNYPPLAKEDALKTTVKRSDIYGVYTGRSRGLGALVLFINTFIGRFLTMILPAIIIFFYDPIIKFVKKLKYNLK